MAKPIKDFHITKLREDTIELYSVKDSSVLMDMIKCIEGVEYVTKYIHASGVMIRTNPLYNIDDIINEVEALLTPIPDIFFEDDESE